MKILVFGAGVLGSYYAATLHESGHDVQLLARGQRLATLRENGLQLAEGDGPIRTVPVPIVEVPDGSHDVTIVLVRTQQLENALATLKPVGGDVLTMSNWAAGPDLLQAALGDAERLMLGFPGAGGVMDGDVVRYTAPQTAARLMPMPVGEANGGTSKRVASLVAAFKQAGLPAAPEHHVDAWLRSHAAFISPMGLAVSRAGSASALADDAASVQTMVADLKHQLRSLPEVRPRPLTALTHIPDPVMVSLLRRFLRTPTAEFGLNISTPAAVKELELLETQLRRTT